MSLKALKDKLFDIYFLCKRVFLILIILTSFLSSKGFVHAASSDTSYFQGKIVIKADGTNLSGNNPSCVITNSADTCDFRVEYYSASTGGTLLWQEDFANIELGDHNGVFSLPLGTGTNNSGSESSYKETFKNNSDVYMQLSFDKDGNGDFDTPETFTTSSGDRMQIRGVPYAIRAEYLDSSNNQFIKNQQTQQTSTNFNIDGNGTIAGIFGVGASNTFYANGATNKVGIGTTNPLGFFSVGENSQFQIDSSGKITAATGITSSGSITFSNLVSGMLKTDNTGLISIATGGTDYEYPLTFSGSLSRDGNNISINQAGATTDGYLSSADWNKFNGNVTSHSSLTDLLTDNHPQYALLTGRTGGQTFTGSIDTNTGLTIKSTSGIGSTGADIIFKTGNNGSTEAMRILNSGNVGIGTTSPKGILDVFNTYAGDPAVSGSTDSNITLRVGAGAIGLDFGTYTNGTSWIQNRYISDLSSNYNLVLQPNGGYVGIGVAVPNQELEVGGRIRMNTWTADGTTAVYKNANGDIGIQASDERLKKNIVNMQSSLDIINSIRTVKFNWLSDTDNAPKTIGVIAQDLLPILPEAVFNYTDPNDGNVYYGVHYEKLGVLALDGIKGLSTEMTSLRTQISTIDQLYQGSLWTVNNDGAMYSTRDVILGNVLATKAIINEIHTDKITALDMNVTRLLTTNKIITSLIEARKDENIAIKLSEKIGNTSFEILNSDGSRIFGINSLGDLDIKGTLNMNGEGNRRTVGTDNVPAGQITVQIPSEAITLKSKVFLSVTDNSEIFPILKVSKVNSGFFEVILDKLRDIDTVFDWFVIN